ncbi:MAG: HTTM domain-containing protein, partial [Ignavibacteria bacterium]
MNRIQQFLNAPASASTLAYFRIGLGILILISTVRFILLGWIDLQYIQPDFHFPYYGLEIFSAPSTPMIYATFLVLLVSSICVILGYRFRMMSAFMFLSFTYIELWDVAFYLNHYYAVSVFSLILCMLPAHVIASLDVKSGRVKEADTVPYWTHLIVFFQIG